MSADKANAALARSASISGERKLVVTTKPPAQPSIEYSDLISKGNHINKQPVKVAPDAGPRFWSCICEDGVRDRHVYVMCDIK